MSSAKDELTQKHGSDKSSESISQVILALSTYGIDCNKDERFQKKEKGGRSPPFSSFPRIPNFPTFGVVVRDIFHACQFEFIHHGPYLLFDVREFIVRWVLIQ